MEITKETILELREWLYKEMGDIEACASSGMPCVPDYQTVQKR